MLEPEIDSKVIQEYRKANNMTQAELAQKLGVSIPTIKRYEKDVTNVPNPKLEELFKILNISLNSMEFLTDIGKEDVLHKLEVITKERNRINHLKIVFKYLEDFYQVIGSPTSDKTFFITEQKNIYFISEEKYDELDKLLKETAEKFFIENNEMEAKK